MSDTLAFVHRQRAGLYAGLVLFLVFPAMGVSALLESIAGIPQGPAPLLVILALATLVYFGFGDENRVELDAHGLRFIHAPTRFGVRGTETLAFEIPASALTTVREVTTRTPSSRGGWNTSTSLHFSDTHRLHDAELGSKGVPGSAYDALVEALRRRLAEGFVVEQVT
jgi:hypothetical protein